MLAGIGAFVAFLYDPRKLFDDDQPGAVPVRDTTFAATTTLAKDYEADGQVVYSGTFEITVNGPVGVVTAIVEPETTLDRGHTLWRVVDEPVVALIGDTPASRSLAQGDVGIDVRELEETLVALGYDPDETVTVDEEYTAYTAAMVERWEEDMGAEVTGAVAGGAVVFLPGITRLGASAFDVGDTISNGDTVLSVTQSDRVLEFTVPASERDSLDMGDVVSARLPDRTTVDATVAKP
ncbi:MAG: peptidoglycan-binding domain-containing protein [Microthrixaceae bacterium]